MGSNGRKRLTTKGAKAQTIGEGGVGKGEGKDAATEGTEENGSPIVTRSVGGQIAG